MRRIAKKNIASSRRKRATYGMPSTAIVTQRFPIMRRLLDKKRKG
jgi:hypothetical protein